MYMYRYFYLHFKFLYIKLDGLNSLKSVAYTKTTPLCWMVFECSFIEC
jgi:hypothetical protein